MNNPWPSARKVLLQLSILQRAPKLELSLLQRRDYLLPHGGLRVLKKDLAARAKILKAASQAPLVEDLKLKAVAEAARQIGQALAANCLAISKLRRWKGSAKEGTLKSAELSQRVGGLEQEVARLHEELQRSQQEAKALVAEKSKEALALSDKNTEL
ncbi:hypothetical protein VNO80_13331 [Phaseolus coccineus]|uniref:Uncharacterized protein n=1 Tax=Phaseolus coccineus TaxID=3886 RepID=A0AAN9RB68_PHACN